jgi:hypothetical protein
MSEDDKTFQDVCQLLDRHNINFWICHGTLLGIIRENRLLPWDHDMDFAVWDFEVSKDEVIDIFVSNGYKQELIFGDIDCLHFYGKNKKIDISFYKVKNNIASIKWIAPPRSFLIKVYLYCIQIIWERSSKNIELSKGIIKKTIQIVLIKLILTLKYFFSDATKNFLYKNSIKYMYYTGYSYPSDLMVFRSIKYNECLIQVPIDSEKCLELTYGNDWKKPKEKYIWYEEASNLA